MKKILKDFLIKSKINFLLFYYAYSRIKMLQRERCELNLENEELQKLSNIAKKVRRGIIEQVYKAQSGHPGGSLSIADILTVLYFKEMNIDEKNPKWEERDRLILSKGHCSPALYSCLANRGFFEKEKLQTFRNIESKLQGHPDMNKVPGVDMTSGSLGQRTILRKRNGY